MYNLSSRTLSDCIYLDTNTDRNHLKFRAVVSYTVSILQVNNNAIYEKRIQFGWVGSSIQRFTVYMYVRIVCFYVPFTYYESKITVDAKQP